jgi:aminoglycoside 6'-N-acetyltransferase
MDVPVRGRLTVVRRATDDDVDLLVTWHADPEVSRYWDDETFTPEEIHGRLRRERVEEWIVEADGDPIGYLQSWWGDFKGDEPADERRHGGLDGFLIPGARGRGLMPDAARSLATALLANGWESVTVDPYAWNERALRGWANAGFVEESRHPPDADHESEWVLMRFDAPGASGSTQEPG